MPSAPRGGKAQQIMKPQKKNIFGNQEKSFGEQSLQINEVWGTFSLSLFLVLCYVVTILQSGDIINNFFQINNAVLYQWGQVNDLVLQGEYWRLITSIFVHACIIHLGGNLLFLIIFGLRYEELTGAKNIFVVFMLTGLAGNLLTLSLSLFGNVLILSVGASGAVEGFFAETIMLLYLRNQYSRGASTMIGFVVLLFIITIGQNTNIFAHLGGLLCGLIYSYIMEKKLKNTKLYRTLIH